MASRFREALARALRTGIGKDDVLDGEPPLVNLAEGDLDGTQALIVVHSSVRTARNSRTRLALAPRSPPPTRD